MRLQSRESPGWRSFGTPTRESRDKKAISMWAPWRGARNPAKGEEAAVTSIIKKVQEVQGGEVMPPNGGIVHPENVQMKPFFPKSNLNTTLNGRDGGI